jgi:hypothetical protein
MRFSTPRFSFAILAIIVIAMQCFGLMHRAQHAMRTASSMHIANEPWLIVANGGRVTASEWQSAVAAKTSDPWHDHASESDCNRFDALCLGDTTILALPELALHFERSAFLARSYEAFICAQTRYALARAPPLA